MAAQNQLSEYNANGTLEDFAKQTKNFSPAEVKLDSIYYEEGQAYSDDSVWVTVNKGTLVSVRANKGDYSLYAAGKIRQARRHQSYISFYRGICMIRLS